MNFKRVKRDTDFSIHCWINYYEQKYFLLNLIYYRKLARICMMHIVILMKRLYYLLELFVTISNVYQISFMRNLLITKRTLFTSHKITLKKCLVSFKSWLSFLRPRRLRIPGMMKSRTKDLSKQTLLLMRN